MYRRVFPLLIVAMALAAAAQENAANLSFTVTKAENSKPVRNASVVLHPVTKDGKQANSGVQLKTDAEGKASYSGAPYGRLRVQVLAPGFQTYGEDFDINEPQKEIAVKLKRPQGQYSIYEDKPKDDKPKQ